MKQLSKHSKAYCLYIALAVILLTGGFFAFTHTQKIIGGWETLYGWYTIFCDAVSNMLPTLKTIGGGLLESAKIFILTLIFALPLGLITALLRMSNNCILKNATRFYISLLRGTPLMLQLLFVYFGPYYLFGISLKGYPPQIAVIIAFSINYSAYFAEIYRGGIQSIPRGQYEAANVLGYSKIQTFFKIILPQVIKRILPPITNEIITLVKDTSLAQVITVAEMFTLAKRLANSQSSLVPLVAAGIFYYIFNYLVASIMERLERKLDYYR